MAHTPKHIRRRTKKFKVAVEKARRARRRRSEKNRMVPIDEAWKVPNHPTDFSGAIFIKPICAEPEPLNPMYYVEHDQEPPPLQDFIERDQNDTTSKEES